MNSLNPQILPATQSKKEHHRAAIIGSWALLVIAIFAGLYWLQISKKAPLVIDNPTPDPEQIIRDNISVFLQDRGGPTSQEATAMERALQPKAGAGAEDKDRMGETLSN